jgi:hypothetical protein
VDLTKPKEWDDIPRDPKADIRAAAVRIKNGRHETWPVEQPMSVLFEALSRFNMGKSSLAVSAELNIPMGHAQELAGVLEADLVFLKGKHGSELVGAMFDIKLKWQRLWNATH